MTRRTVRALQVVAGAAAAAMLIAACGSSSKPNAQQSTIGPITGTAASSVVPWAASGQATDTTVTVCFFSGPEFDTIQKHGTDFTALTGGKIKIKMVSIPIAQALPVTINQLKTSSECDLVDGASEHATDLNPYLLPLGSMMSNPALLNSSVYNLSDFPKGVLDVATSSNGLMSLPFSADVQMIFYRADLMSQWGITVPKPPESWTWQQFEAALQTMQAKIKENNLDMSPIAITGSQDASASMFSLTSMWAFGGNPFNGDQPNFTDQKAVEGLSRWSGLLNTLKLASPGSPTYAYNELLTALQQGKVPMIAEWNAAVTDLNDPTKSPITAGKLGFALLPYDESLPANTPRVFPTTHTLGISAKSAHPREAFEFAAWYTSPEVALQLASERSSGARTSALTDPATLAKNPALGTVAAAGALYHQLPNIPSFGDLLNNVIAPSVNSLFTGQKTPDQAAADMQSGAETLLKKAGK
jgi:multiple sugar transport system substrate-binding protein